MRPEKGESSTSMACFRGVPVSTDSEPKPKDTVAISLEKASIMVVSR